jgi:hypothetical protein
MHSDDSYRTLRYLTFSVVCFFASTTIVLYKSISNMDDEDYGLSLSRRHQSNFDLPYPQASGRKLQLTRRETFELDFSPHDMDRIVNVNQLLKVPNPKPPKVLPYDVYKCPPTPPVNYPYQWLLVDLLTDWNPDRTNVPDQIYQGLCVFDWSTDKAKVLAYRTAEKPFVVQGHPEVLRATERWNHPGYLSSLIGNNPKRNEYSRNNHFMFWRALGSVPAGWTPPTKNVPLTYDEWLARAKVVQDHPDHATQEHWYFRLNGAPHQNSYLYDELPMFQEKENVFMVDPSQARGINCRFGMKGVIAESHFDFTRNWVLLLGGQRRYILSSPDQCRSLDLYKNEHPSARHSQL